MSLETAVNVDRSPGLGRICNPREGCRRSARNVAVTTATAVDWNAVLLSKHIGRPAYGQLSSAKRTVPPSMEVNTRRHCDVNAMKSTASRLLLLLLLLQWSVYHRSTSDILVRPTVNHFNYSFCLLIFKDKLCY